MRKIILIIAALLCIDAVQAQEKQQLTQFVNPFVGTDFHGHTFPGATYPFGMVQLSPDTRLTGWDGCSGYHYSDTTVYGFSHTHLSGTGVSDYGDILIMPVSGYSHPKISNELYKSSFSHKKEKATPGYYEVYLDSYGILAQLTAGKRVGMHKYTFKKGDKPQIILDLVHRDAVIDSKIEIGGKSIIKGYRQSKKWAEDQIVYFYIEFSEPVADALLYKDDEISKDDLIKKDGNTKTSGFKKSSLASTSISGKNCKAIFTFGSSKNNEVILKIGISSVSEENAKLNLYSEVEGWEFEKLRADVQNAWNSYLNKIEIKTDNLENKKIFYTALYHTAISPNIYSDVNGEYRGMDRKVHKAIGYDQYTVFSLWDTYRALHPLFTIIEQNRTVDFIKSFLAMYREAGKLPIWELSGNETNCMIGYHSVSVMADALKKGIGNFDTKYALEAMIESSNKKEFGIDIYARNGYIPAEKEHESVSKTLEYAYDDWCIAQFARMTGRADVYKEYIRRAQYYKNNFDASTGFMRPKLLGKWLEPFSPTEVNVHFIEANSWQYSFYVPQDIETHIKMVGGDDAYSRKLDELFSASNKTTGRTQVDITGLIGQYAHGNEPSHHTAYLYNYTGKPWKTQEIVRQIMTTLYSSAPDGLCGNDDCGQMSAWYVFSALGFYPVTPGDDIYAIGSPLFSSATIYLEDGNNTSNGKTSTNKKKFTINSSGNSKENIYVNSACLNGNLYSKSYISHKEILNGSTFDFAMSSSPNLKFATDYSDRPHSRISDFPIVENPWFEMPNNIFKDSVIVEIKSALFSGNQTYKGHKIYYKINNIDIPDKLSGFTEYSGPLTIKSNCTINAYCINDSGEKSFTVTTRLNKIFSEWKIKILSHYNPQYNAGGDVGLIDGVRGELNFRLGGWQGYQDTDFTAIVDLGSATEINSIGAGFLQDAKSWIWMPKYAEFSTSADGVNFETFGIVYNGMEENDLTPKILDFVSAPVDKKSIDNKQNPVKNATQNVIQNGTQNGTHNCKRVARYIKVFAKNIGAIPDWHDGAGGQGFIFVDEIFVQ